MLTNHQLRLIYFFKVLEIECRREKSLAKPPSREKILSILCLDMQPGTIGSWGLGIPKGEPRLLEEVASKLSYATGKPWLETHQYAEDPLLRLLTALDLLGHKKHSDPDTIDIWNKKIFLKWSDREESKPNSKKQASTIRQVQESRPLPAIIGKTQSPNKRSGLFLDDFCYKGTYPGLIFSLCQPNVDVLCTRREPTAFMLMASLQSWSWNQHDLSDLEAMGVGTRIPLSTLLLDTAASATLTAINADLAEDPAQLQLIAAITLGLLLGDEHSAEEAISLIADGALEVNLDEDTPQLLRAKARGCRDAFSEALISVGLDRNKLSDIARGQIPSLPTSSV